MKFSYFSDAIEIIKKRSRILVIVLICVYLFGSLLGLIVGVYSRQLEEKPIEIEVVSSILSPIRKFVSQGKFWIMPFYIFFHNLRAAILLTISGVILIPPFIFLFSNGYIIGLFTGIVPVPLSVYVIPYLVGVIIVFLFEFIALVLASVEGIYLGLSLISPKKIFKKKISRKKAFFITFKQSLKVYLIIIVFLFLASLIETGIVYSVLSNLIQCGINFESVIPGSPAENVGLEPTIIIKVNHQKIRNVTEFGRMIDKIPPGNDITLTTIKGNEYRITLTTPPKGANFTHGFIGIENVETAWVKKDKCPI